MSVQKLIHNKLSNLQFGSRQEKEIFKAIEKGNLEKDFQGVDDVVLYDKAKAYVGIIQELEGLIKKIMSRREKRYGDAAMKNSNFYAAAKQLADNCHGINLEFLMSDLKIKKGWFKSPTITKKAWQKIRTCARCAHEIFESFVSRMMESSKIEQTINLLDRQIDQIVKPAEYKTLTDYLLADNNGTESTQKAKEAIDKLTGDKLKSTVSSFETQINDIMESLRLLPYMKETITQTCEYINNKRTMTKDDLEKLKEGGSEYPLFYKINYQSSTERIVNAMNNDPSKLYAEITAQLHPHHILNN